MPELEGEFTIEELDAQLVSRRKNRFTTAEEEALEPITDTLRDDAVRFATENGAEAWLIKELGEMSYMEGIVAEMRHLPKGQEYILQRLMELNPDLQWYRGGTLKCWGDEIGNGSRSYFTEEQLNTYVIDGGRNGILGSARIPLNFLKLTPRETPVLYSIPIQDLLEGLQDRSISLTTEHFYDLNVNEGNDRSKYLTFCKEKLHIQRVKV